ncbi:MAG: nucleotide exchange factor GrpE [Bacillota bacterium]
MTDIERETSYNNNGNNEEQEEKDVAALKEELEMLRGELEETKNRHLRTRADFDNFRKRTEREAEAKRINAKKEILLDLLKFLDYFDQARKQVQDPAAAKGLDIMARQFHELLHKHGVRPIKCLGQPFDPEEHEGVGYITTEDYQEGCVAEELCCGYKFGDILLQPARVMVAKNPE